MVKRVFVRVIAKKDSDGVLTRFVQSAATLSANIPKRTAGNNDQTCLAFLQDAIGSVCDIQIYLIIAQDLNWDYRNATQELVMLFEQQIEILQNFITT